MEIKPGRQRYSCVFTVLDQSKLLFIRHFKTTNMTVINQIKGPRIEPCGTPEIFFVIETVLKQHLKLMYGRTYVLLCYFETLKNTSLSQVTSKSHHFNRSINPGSRFPVSVNQTYEEEPHKDEAGGLPMGKLKS